MKIKGKSIVLVMALSVLLLFIPLEIFGQSTKIPYKQLSWSDFQGTPGVFPKGYTGEKLDFSAFTWTYLSGNWNFHEIDSSGCQYEFTQVTGTASFFLTESWITQSAKTGQNSMRLLNHEQKHLDLTEIQARGFESELLGKTFSCPGGVYDVAEINEITKQIFQKYLDGLGDLHRRYDLETEHYNNIQKQADWNLKIDCMLKNNGQSNYCLSLTSDGEIEPESEPAPALSESVIFKNPRILDSSGNLITTASVGQFVTFTALVENQQSTEIPFAFATIVKNTQGILQTETWITGSLSPGQSFEPMLTWETDAPENYVFSFELWNNAKDRTLLAEPHTLQIAVKGAPEPEPTYEPVPEYEHEPVPEYEHEPVPEYEHEPILEPTTPVMPSYADVILPEGSGVPGCEETNECYIPYRTTINVGESVKWSNVDTAAHTVTSGTTTDGPDGVFDSRLFGAGDTFSWKPDSAGEFSYFCMLHPWMIGKVIVKETTVTSIPPPVLAPEPPRFVGIPVDSSVPGQTGHTFEDRLDNAQEQRDNRISNPSSQDDLSELIDENRKLREELERQGEQIDDLNQEVDLLKQIIQNIQGFFSSIFG